MYPVQPSPFEVRIEESGEESNPSLSFPWNVTQYWRECLLITGVIVAVIGIAIAITSGAIPCAICFGVALAVSLVGLYLVCQDRSLEQLQQTCHQLAGQTEALQQLLDELQQTNANLAATQEELHAEVELLHGRIQQLTLIATQLTASATAIETEVRRFQEGNQQFSGNLDSLRELSEQIQRANALREQVLAGYQEAWQTSVEQLSQRMDALQETLRDDDAWRSRWDMLNRARNSLERTQQEHAAATASLNATTERLEALHEQLQHFEQQFGAQLEGLSGERQGFAQLRQQFQELFQQAVPKNE